MQEELSLSLEEEEEDIPPNHCCGSSPDPAMTVVSKHPSIKLINGIRSVVIHPNPPKLSNKQHVQPGSNQFLALPTYVTPPTTFLSSSTTLTTLRIPAPYLHIGLPPVPVILKKPIRIPASNDISLPPTSTESQVSSRIPLEDAALPTVSTIPMPTLPSEDLGHASNTAIATIPTPTGRSDYQELYSTLSLTVPIYPSGDAQLLRGEARTAQEGSTAPTQVMIPPRQIKKLPASRRSRYVHCHLELGELG
jgi:hypothetical protein